MRRFIRIFHERTGMLLAEGPLGWGITPFEGNFYISRKYLCTDRFKSNFLPGLCPYKFLYVWLDLILDNGRREKNLGWMYWLPNPLLPFIWFRVALPRSHPSLVVERYERQKHGELAKSHAGKDASTIDLNATIMCPLCRSASPEIMSTDRCQFFYECRHCHAILKPKPGDCCVFCSFGDKPCPLVQVSTPTECSLTTRSQ